MRVAKIYFIFFLLVCLIGWLIGIMQTILKWNWGFFFFTFNLQILSRKTHMEEEIYNELVQKAVEEGYDVSKLHKTPQSNPPPETEEGPADAKGIWWFKSILGK